LLGGPRTTPPLLRLLEGRTMVARSALPRLYPSRRPARAGLLRIRESVLASHP
jgi:hypothetical protein